ncbi:BT4734/BF3469 family protein [Hymenobacter psoromatis]|uniref:BT4734/BF3469 family protein n=1 Tax=Hymenobacter psoromatis TaxID=1484116 RepID=UPI001CBD07BC|nr:BT4734/BF3469 family protein [Hymenobacter psoromatis]
MLPTPARSFGADALACALTLAGTNTPTSAELTAALAELYPNNTGPTVPDLLAAGWLAPAISDRTRLRQPPLPPAEVNARLAAANEPDKTRCFAASALAESRNEAGIKPEFSESLKKADNRREAGVEVEKVESLKKAGNRRKADAEPPTLPATNGAKAEPAGPLFSYYRGGIAATVPYAAITPAQLFTVLTSARHRAATEALRAAPVGSPRRAELKKGLDYVTPAGTFTRRANEALAEASGLLVLDFDHVPDVAAARAALLADALLAPDLVLLFTSPSGDGLKVLTKADPRAAHLDNFRAYAAYLAAHYAPLGLCPDEAGKDVARACFVPYAPDAWLAPAYAA